MDWIRVVTSRCSAFFGRSKPDEDLDAELQAHIELAIEENLKRGLSRGEARTPFAAAARDLAAKMSPDIPAPVIVTLESQLDDSISSERMMAMLAAFFGACALFVTAI